MTGRRADPQRAIARTLRAMGLGTFALAPLGGWASGLFTGDRHRLEIAAGTRRRRRASPTSRKRWGRWNGACPAISSPTSR
ncbi:hypothetical protein [Sphingomonas sp. ID0503]|uniref:hypothetical protein n=1 Tax=Sphingomonas sp. ID0503 TaxID=3399691 RepID=UPI003AFA77A9